MTVLKVEYIYILILIIERKSLLDNYRSPDVKGRFGLPGLAVRDIFPGKDTSSCVKVDPVCQGPGNATDAPDQSRFPNLVEVDPVCQGPGNATNAPDQSRFPNVVEVNPVCQGPGNATDAPDHSKCGGVRPGLPGPWQRH